MVLLFYTTCVCVDLAHHEIFHAKVNNGGINTIPASIFFSGTNKI